MTFDECYDGTDEGGSDDRRHMQTAVTVELLLMLALVVVLAQVVLR